MEEVIQTFLMPGAWVAIITLAFLEVILGIDNIVFLSIMTGKLPEKQQPRARIVGLGLAMVARLVLLFFISELMKIKTPFYVFDTKWISGGINLQSLIMLVGGLFLLYKAITEIHRKVEGKPVGKAKQSVSFWGVITQIVAIDIVLSLDSVLTAVGMVNFNTYGFDGALAIMATAIIASVAVMILFAGPVSNFVNRHPTIQMMALSFLILIGVMLFVEAFALADIKLFGKEVHEIPKGYIYFAIAFSMLVEWLNMRMSSKAKKEKPQVEVAGSPVVNEEKDISGHSTTEAVAPAVNTSKNAGSGSRKRKDKGNK